MKKIIMKTPGPRSRQEGFTLLEVLAAIVILTVGLLGMAALTASIVSAGALSRDRVTASTLAQSKLEELKNTGFSSLVGGTDTHGAFARSWSVSSGAPVAGSATIEVTVSWTWGGDTRFVDLLTIRAE